jgi:hypothetical protein
MGYQQKYKWLLLIFLILLFFPYLYISRFANPVADDLIYAFNGKNHALFKLLIRDYLNWNGRYSSNVLVFTNPMSYDSLIAYKLAPVVILALTACSYFFLLTVFFEKCCALSERLVMTLLLSLLFLYQLPILSEGIYWYTGAVTYQVANCMSTVYICLLKQYTDGKLILKSKFIHAFLLSILLILLIGFNEISMIAMLLFALISLIIAWKNNLPHRSLFIVLLMLTFLSASLMFFAPGNTGRASLATGNHRFFYSLLFSLAQTLRFFAKWVSSVPLLLLSVCYYYLNKKLSEKIPLFSVSFYLSPVYSAGILFLVIFIAVFPPYWSLGMLGQHRTLNVAYHLFLLAWFINLTVFFNRYKVELNAVKPLKQKSLAMIMGIILASFCLTRNGYAVWSDIFYDKAVAYDQQMKERAELMQSQTDTIYFQPIANPPQSLFLYDITGDPGNWLNQSYTLYYQCKDKILVKK